MKSGWKRNEPGMCRAGDWRLFQVITCAWRWTEVQWLIVQGPAQSSQDSFQANEQVRGHKVLLWAGQGFQVPGGLQHFIHPLYEVLQR